MKKSKAIFCVLAFFLSVCHADTIPDLNSLLKGLAPAKQIKVLDSISSFYRKSNLDFSFTCINKALGISEKEKLPEQQSRCQIARAFLYKRKGIEDSAVICFDLAQAVLNANHLDGKPLNHLYNQKGTFYYRNGDFKTASDLYFKSLEIAERVNDEEAKSAAYNCIGNVFFRQEAWDKAIEYYTEALKINIKLNKPAAIAGSNDNIGLAYSNKGDLKTAIKYQVNAVKVIEQLNKSDMLSEGYFNLASTYNLLGLNDSSGIYATKSLTLSLKNGNDRITGNSYYLLGVVSYNDKKYSEALGYLKNAHAIYVKNGLKSQQLDLLGYVSATFNALGRNDSAYFYEKQHYALHSEILSGENTEMAKELSEKYQSEKKQKEIELLQKENQVKDANEKQLKTRNAALIGLALFILIISLITYRRFVEKKKDNVLLENKNRLITDQKAVIEEKNKSITDSILYARRIQFSVLPTEQQVKNNLPDCFVYYAPKDIISGDFYWIVSRGERIYMAVADCTGHGVPGALMSMLGSSFLNQIVLEKNILETAAVLKELHRMVLTTLNEDLEHRISKDGMDIGLICRDKKKGTITFSGAGRPLYVISNNQLSVVKGDKMSVGGIYSVEETNYAEHVIKAEKGLKFYLFSDGVPDQFGGPRQKKLTVKRLAEWIEKNHVENMNVQKENFTTFMNQWKGNTEQIDDMTFVGIDFSDFA